MEPVTIGDSSGNPIQESPHRRGSDAQMQRRLRIAELFGTVDYEEDYDYKRLRRMDAHRVQTVAGTDF